MAFYSNKKNATWDASRQEQIEVYDDPNNQQGLTSNMMAYSIQSEAGQHRKFKRYRFYSENWVAQAIAIRPLVINLEFARTNPLSTEIISELAITEGTSSLQGDEVSGEIIAYPNPVKDRLNLRLKGIVEDAPTEIFARYFGCDGPKSSMEWSLA